MTHYVTAVRMAPSNGTGHEHIGAVQWLNATTGQTGSSDTAAMIRFVDDGHEVRVRDGQGSVRVGAWHANPPYLRTYTDNRWTDNLLSLPRY